MILGGSFFTVTPFHLETCEAPFRSSDSFLPITRQQYNITQASAARRGWNVVMGRLQKETQ